MESCKNGDRWPALQEALNTMTMHQDEPKQIYMFYVGGSAGRCNIELHDVQFAAAARAEDAWPVLRKAWFGDPASLHVDGYMPITWADGYDVSLGDAPCPSGLHLFFVNMGGYNADHLAEMHEFALFVATDEAAVKARAKKELLRGANLRHKDDLREVDNCLALDEIGGMYVQLAANPQGTKARPAWQGYRPIGIEKPPRTRGE